MILNDEHWMTEALVLARQAAAQGEVPVGAVVVQDGTIIGRGSNNPIGSCDASSHAEICALRDAGQRQKNYRLPNATLYVTIEPCTMCLGAIVHARIARVVFGAQEPKAGVLESNPELLSANYFNHEFEWSGGVCAQECSEVIQQFFKFRRESKKRLRNQADGLG
ncbi:tRNA adenosine(34) deaminase TadA [Teredinibacter turnerae]|uniref:tRNA adenosine(34) deaminase TadA n=1 Tax=Teredinibacter turnerae TaxID=2426 RepID=UPI000425791D|nr:tRNA adenosine(34) deaminase TadA [Teredinibacter turnerae]